MYQDPKAAPSPAGTPPGRASTRFRWPCAIRGTRRIERIAVRSMGIAVPLRSSVSPAAVVPDTCPFVFLLVDFNWIWNLVRKSGRASIVLVSFQPARTTIVLGLRWNRTKKRSSQQPKLGSTVAWTDTTDSRMAGTRPPIAVECSERNIGAAGLTTYPNVLRADSMGIAFLKRRDADTRGNPLNKANTIVPAPGLDQQPCTRTLRQCCRKGAMSAPAVSRPPQLC